MNLQPSGIVNSPLKLNWDVIPAISNASLIVGIVEVGNGSGSDIEAGWGCEQYSKIGKWDDSLTDSFYQPDTLFPITLDLVDTDDGIVILTPFACDALTLTVATSSATAIVIQQFDGSAFTTVSGGTVREDVSATGIRNNVFPGLVKAAKIPAAGFHNLPGGWYALKIKGGNSAVISAIRAGYCIDRVGLVSDGNSLAKTYDKNLMPLLRSYSLFSYMSGASANNFVSVSFAAS